MGQKCPKLAVQCQFLGCHGHRNPVNPLLSPFLATNSLRRINDHQGRLEQNPLQFFSPHSRFVDLLSQLITGLCQRTLAHLGQDPVQFLWSLRGEIYVGHGRAVSLSGNQYNDRELVPS